jgi:hypothetical protein
MGSTASEPWLSVGEAGRALGLSRTSLLAAEEAGLLASVRTPGGHRRYRPAELRRYLRAAGAGEAAWAADPGATDSGPHLDARRIFLLDVATALRTALRPVARALAAECVGVYLIEDGALRFCAAFGIPRWLVERLAATEAPAALRHARDARHVLGFDPSAAAFPEPRSTGEGFAVALRHGEQAVGVLFAVLPAEAHAAAELRTVDAFAELLALTVADRSRIGELEHTIATVAALTAGRETDVRGI